jgi:uncharacterized protein YyaL (SSP411 family)
MNRLANERSPYLQHAASQKIDWHPWSEEVFQRAFDEDKPVFLSTGAVWCHWCHVMAQECFENEEIADMLNENFVCIKLDRDERPDIDRRYQQAVVAISSAGGWPLSVFLTPDKMPFFGGTYFPVTLTVHAAAGSELAITALRGLNPFRSIVYAENTGPGIPRVIPCMGQVCHEPVSDPQRLTALLRNCRQQ